MSSAGKEAAKKPEDQRVLGADQRSRPDLSDAGEEAEKDPEDQDIVNAQQKKTRNLADDELDAETGLAVALVPGIDDNALDDTGEPTDEAKDDGAFHFGIVGGYGALSGDEINGYPVFGVALGVTSKTDRFGLELRLMGSSPTLTDATGIAEGIEKEEQFAIDGMIRYYTTPIHTFVGFCVIAGVRWGMLGWSYKNPIEYNDGYGEITEISRDDLQYLTPYIGAGLNIIQTRRLVLGADVTGGYKIYKFTTEEGFDNDVLDDEWSVQFMAGLYVVFGR